MKKIYIKLLSVGVLLFFCHYIKFQDFEIQEYEIIEYVYIEIDGDVIELPIEEYLLGVVVGEMPASFELEALKAQVVASRTYVYDRNLKVDNTTNTQVYLNEAQRIERLGINYNELENKIIVAISETSGEVLLYENDYISALFFSSSSGFTQNNNDYFNGEAIAYLQSVDSQGEELINPNFIKEYVFNNEEIESKFGVNSNFNIISYNENGSVSKLLIDQKEYTGREVREILGLASNYFTIDKTNQGYVFTTSGSGHGVGMSQYGAQLMALNGITYDQILLHYYQGVEIIKK